MDCRWNIDTYKLETIASKAEIGDLHTKLGILHDV